MIIIIIIFVTISALCSKKRKILLSMLNSVACHLSLAYLVSFFNRTATSPQFNIYCYIYYLFPNSLFPFMASN